MKGALDIWDRLAAKNLENSPSIVAHFTYNSMSALLELKTFETMESVIRNIVPANQLLARFDRNVVGKR